MPDQEPTIDHDRVSTRSELSAEEKAAGSDDPQAQAEAILAESEERIVAPDSAPGANVEHRTSEETTPPLD